MELSSWPVAEAKARFSELLNWVERDGAQQITRNGAPAAILVRPGDWRPQPSRSASDCFGAGREALALSDAEVDELFLRPLGPMAAASLRSVADDYAAERRARP